MAQPFRGLVIFFKSMLCKPVTRLLFDESPLCAHFLLARQSECLSRRLIITNGVKIKFLFVATKFSNFMQMLDNIPCMLTVLIHTNIDLWLT